MRLKGLDLNLLIALDVLLEERNVSRAAERLHLSQPAASAALGRLRNFFKDELLVLYGKRMIATSYAENLVPEVKAILTRVERMISQSAQFDPTRSVRSFQLMASDYVTTVLLIPLAARLEQLAPNVTINIRLPHSAVMAEFERGEVDLILVPEDVLSVGHPSELIFEEPHVVVGSADNPIFDTDLTLEAFLSADHVGVRLGPTNDLTFTERYLEMKGETRKMAVFAPNFSVVPGFLLGTRRLALMQLRMALAYRSVVPLKIAPLPFEQPRMRVMAQYHTVRSTDSSVRWLLDRLHAVADDIGTKGLFDNGDS